MDHRWLIFANDVFTQRVGAHFHWISKVHVTEGIGHYRGEPGKFLEIKFGIWHKSAESGMPIIPDYMHDLDRSTGKGQRTPMSFYIDMFIDEPLFYDADKVTFKQSLFTRFVTLQQQATRKII